MLSKLVKYDIKSLIRVFIPIWIAAPIVAVMLSGAIHLISVSDGPLINLFSEYVGPILLGILTILFVAVIVGMMIMTLILVIRRFWNGLLKEEGYLAFTLPVEVWQLIVSKVIVAAIVNLISGLIAALSCLILFLGISKEIFYSRAWCLHRCSDRAWNPVPDRHKHLRNLYALCIYVSGSVDGGSSGSRIISGLYWLKYGCEYHH